MSSATLISRILVPVDFSTPSSAAVTYAFNLARTFGAAVDIVHVCPLLLYAMASDAPPDAIEFERNLQLKLQGKLDELAQQLRSDTQSVTTHLIEGAPYEGILNTAKRVGADLIVMATHGHTGFKHLLLGSVAERVVRLSEAPVLTVRAPEAG